MHTSVIANNKLEQRWCSASRRQHLATAKQRHLSAVAGCLPGIFSFMITPKQADSQCPWIAWKILAAMHEAHKGQQGLKARLIGHVGSPTSLPIVRVQLHL